MFVRMYAMLKKTHLIHIDFQLGFKIRFQTRDASLKFQFGLE